MNSIPAHGEVHSIQLYVIKFLGDLNNYIHVKNENGNGINSYICPQYKRNMLEQNG